jgi:hypothetical protein
MAEKPTTNRFSFRTLILLLLPIVLLVGVIFLSSALAADWISVPPPRSKT